MSDVYSVDEVSLTLGIPRPTLYRYLREYSVPHLKRSGRISIPAASVEKIRRVRDLHGEGMGTGAVRRVLKEEARGEGGTARRLDGIPRDLNVSKVEPRHQEDASQALRTLLARQTLLVDAVLDLTDMVEELMRSTGHQARRRTGTGEVALHDASTTARMTRPGEYPASPSPVTYLTPREGSPRPKAGGRETTGASPTPPGLERPAPNRSVPGRARGGRAVRVARSRQEGSGARGASRGGYGTLARRRRSAVINCVLAASVAVLILALLLFFGVI